MITSLSLKNFKSIEGKLYEFTKLDLLVGRNNSGKSTILQALAIWQFCIDEFHRTKRTGKTGKQIVLPNFTALPVPEFNLLWKDRTDRRYPFKGDKRATPEYILIDIDVTWLTRNNEKQSFAVRLRYNSPQTLYAIPSIDWTSFRALDKDKTFPVIAFVPPFSGLEPTEEWRDDGPIRKQIGKAQPGSVLRNLLYRVVTNSPNEWKEIKDCCKRWFSVDLKEPQYEKGVDTQIICEYSQGGKPYDIIAGGSGFHQVLTLLAFLYGYKPTTILLDEPDAHLHVNLQREILEYFKRKSQERNTQFLIATHAEEFAKGVEVSQLLSLLGKKHERVNSTPAVLRAMADISNPELNKLWDSPFIVYVEGESDERILRAWAGQCSAEEYTDKVYFRPMGGGTKEQMKDSSDKHFEALRQIIPSIIRMILFDYDDADAFHPELSNPVVCEWKRKNIENYLLVPEAWIRTAVRLGNLSENDMFAQPLITTIQDFFTSENLTLPKGKSWKELDANVFKVVDGKKILFEDEDSLFQRLRRTHPSAEVPREAVALAMMPEEIHSDVYTFFDKLKKNVDSLKAAEGQSSA